MHPLQKRSRTFKLAVLPRVPKPNMPRVWRKAADRPTTKQEQPRKVPSYVFDCVLIHSFTCQTHKTMEPKNEKIIDSLIENGTMNASEYVFNTKVISSENARHIAKGAYEAGRIDTKKKSLEIADNIDNTADRTLIKDMLDDLL